VKSVGVRRVPVSYTGYAREVYIKGSFDSWGTGLRLSCRSTGNAVISEFEGDLLVSPVGPQAYRPATVSCAYHQAYS
jgi:hypothetical protein